MNRKWRIPPIHRSLVVQITLLSCAPCCCWRWPISFSCLIMEMERDPVDRTESLVLHPCIGYVMFSDPKMPLDTIAESEDVQAAAAANSSFRLYVRRGSEEFRMGEEPRWEGASDFPQQASRANVEEQGGSSYARIDEGASRALIQTGLWDGEAWYVEMGGIETPIAKATSLLGGTEPIVFWMSVAEAPGGRRRNISGGPLPDSRAGSLIAAPGRNCSIAGSTGSQPRPAGDRHTHGDSAHGKGDQPHDPENRQGQ